MPRLEHHAHYARDTRRLDAYSRALQHVIRPQHVVLDLGAGTGVLGLLACRAGARKVYAIEAGPIAGLARDMAAANGVGDRVVVLREHSYLASLPERVDVIVCDQLGPLGIDGGIREYMQDARERFGAGPVTTIPAAFELFVAGCEAPRLREALTIGSPAGIDLSWHPLERMLRATPASGVIAPESLVTAPARLGAVSLDRGARGAIRATLRLPVTRAGTLDAVAAWFRAELAPQVWMTNAPGHDRIDRGVALLPVSPAIELAAGQTIVADLRVDTEATGTAWTIRVEDASGTAIAALSRSSFEGLVFSAEDVGAGETGVRLSREGGMARQVLDLCDGHRSAAEIERAMFDLHRDALSSPAAAHDFVTAVLRCYGA
jgi:hypothetical protein